MLKVPSLVFLLTLAALMASIDDANASTGMTTRVSVDSQGGQSNDASLSVSISADGRHVAFQSDATNLVEGDTNGTSDVFVHDQQMGTTVRVSVGDGGRQADDGSAHPAISANGRFVAFTSVATNLVPEDTNLCGPPPGVYRCPDIFVHDRDADEDSIFDEPGAVTTTAVSLDSAGNQGAGGFIGSLFADISADGRFVAFWSDATNLVTGDTNGNPDIFVRDRQTGVTTRVSVDSAGNQVISVGGQEPAISGDGRYVAFQSSADDVVPGDSNVAADIFVHDRETGATERVSVDSTGAEANGGSGHPAMSADGRYVAFSSSASNLVAADTPTCHGFPISCADVFVHDRQTGKTTLLSAGSDGTQENGFSCCPAISADGRFVAFWSQSTNLVPGDTNDCGFGPGRCPDVFVHDRLTGVTTRVSVDSGGAQGNGGSFYPAISADGRFVAFWSQSTNLVPGDTNGVRDVFVHDLGSSSDSDSDGVPDGVDSCPFTSSMGFDADADGCIDTLDGLIAMVESLTPEPKIEAGLLTKLNGAQTALDRDNMRVAVNNLRSFINQVKAQRGKSLTSPQADLLAAYANNLILLM